MVSKNQSTAIAVLVGAVIAVRFFLWQPIIDWLKEKSNEEKETGTITIVKGENTPTGSPVEFSVWRVGDYQKLLSNNISVKLSRNPKYIADLLRNSGLSISGINTTVDTQFLGAIKMCSYQTVVNQVITEWAKNSTWYNSGNDFLAFAKQGLSDENYLEMLNYVTRLPKGFKT